MSDLAKEQDFDVSRFQNYRTLISSWLAWKQQLRGGFSLRLLAKRAGIQSPTFLSDVLAGKKNVSLETAKSLAQTMNLNAAEEKFFVALVRLNQSRTEAEQSEALRGWQTALVGLREDEVGDELTQKILSTWYFIIAAILTRVKGAKRDAKWLVEHMYGLITEREAENCLKVLAEMEESTGKKGAALFDATRQMVFRKKQEFGLAQSTIDMFGAWQKLLSNMHTNERFMNTLVLPLSKKGMERLKTRIAEISQELSGISIEDDGHDRVMWCALYLIPATRVVG